LNGCFRFAVPHLFIKFLAGDTAQRGICIDNPSQQVRLETSNWGGTGKEIPNPAI